MKNCTAECLARIRSPEMREVIERGPAGPSEVNVFGHAAMALTQERLAGAVRFVLPDGGKILDDPELRALPRDVPIRLPFPAIAVEMRPHPDGLPGDVPVPYRMTLCVDDPEIDAIRCATWFFARGIWLPMPLHAFSRTEWVENSAPPGSYHWFRSFPKWHVIQGGAPDLVDEFAPIIGMLNALACSNVGIHKVEPSRTRRAMLAAKGITPSPMDTYHELVIRPMVGGRGKGLSGGSHRSPREHVRRGHVRTLADGRHIWVNSAVVNAGAPAKVSKHYRIGDRK